MERLTLQQKTVTGKWFVRYSTIITELRRQYVQIKIFFCRFTKANKLIAVIPFISSQHFAVATADIRAAKEQTIWQPANKRAPSIYTHTVIGDRCSCGGSDRSGLINDEPPVCKTRSAHRGCLLDRWRMTPSRKPENIMEREELRAEPIWRGETAEATAHAKHKTHEKKNKAAALQRHESVMRHTVITTPTGGETPCTQYAAEGWRTKCL